ncbi:MAG: Uncharacterized protein HW401_604 [Parcubacteria group bacterium]|nr:Uncharacterized protein [Parcubacteria group bacterium]
MIFRAFKKVFQKPLYAAIGILTGLTSFVFIIWLPNIWLVAEVLFSSGSFLERIALPVSLIGTISTNFTALSASFVIAMAILFGMNVAMTAFFIRRRLSSVRQSGTAVGLIGTVIGTLGVGCAACGSILLTTVLAWIGAGALIRLLSMRGEEFGIAGVIILASSLFLTAKQIENPAVCRI